MLEPRFDDRFETPCDCAACVLCDLEALVSRIETGIRAERIEDPSLSVRIDPSGGIRIECREASVRLSTERVLEAERPAIERLLPRLASRVASSRLAWKLSVALRRGRSVVTLWCADVGVDSGSGIGRSWLATFPLEGGRKEIERRLDVLKEVEKSWAPVTRAALFDLDAGEHGMGSGVVRRWASSAEEAQRHEDEWRELLGRLGLGDSRIGLPFECVGSADPGVFALAQP